MLEPQPSEASTNCVTKAVQGSKVDTSGPGPVLGKSWLTGISHSNLMCHPTTGSLTNKGTGTSLAPLTMPRVLGPYPGVSPYSKNGGRWAQLALRPQEARVPGHHFTKCEQTQSTRDEPRPHARQVLARGLPHIADLRRDTDTRHTPLQGTQPLPTKPRQRRLPEGGMVSISAWPPHVGQTLPTVQQPYW